MGFDAPLVASMLIAPENTDKKAVPSPRRLHQILLLLIVLAAIYQVVDKWLIVAFGMHGVDYSVLWAAGRNVIEGHGVYAERATALGNDHWEVFKYPQATALLFFWLGALPGEMGEVIWKSLMLVALFASIAVLGTIRPRASNVDTDQMQTARLWVADHWLLVVFFLLAACSPAAMALRLGQIGPLLLLVMSAVTALLWQKRNSAAGVIWTCAILIKVSPVLLAVPLLLWHRWRAIATATLVGLGYLAILAVTGRLSDEWYYFTKVLPQIPFLARYVSHSPFSAVIEPTIGAGLSELAYNRLQSTYGLAMIVVYVVALWAMRRRGADFARVLPFALIGITAASPLVEHHHFVASYPALLVQLALWCEGRHSTRMLALAMVGWIPIMLSGSAAPEHLGQWGLYIAGWANLWVWGVAAAEGLRSPSTLSSAQSE
ncbi:hypothetical protein CVU37_03425 [candidate division BRC1 bacterium HGW-BRC1-1]|jgi:hypothetical protein|nr:MAG: hypothetical protein CVU37_03425 [candidate division BRC1 bacterium HGW-BRC1-1]